ncbi:MAG: glycosyltransferase family 25 protein [Phycisphaeraceae bacterium]|nr:glycosyltransferase family 25 protein [Phycisphaeraceae bacterium]
MTRIIVAGLARRQDRRRLVEQQLRANNVANYVFAADLDLTVDWQEWEPDDIRRLTASCYPWRLNDSTNPWWNRSMTLGEIACTLTHWAIWNYAAQLQYTSLIVLEDDAILLHAFEDRERLIQSLFCLDPYWDLLYLGRERLEPDRDNCGEFVRPGFSYCTHGYALSRKGIQLLLSTPLMTSIIPVDEFLPAMYMEHPRHDVRRRFSPILAAYGLNRDIVEVKGSAHMGSDTENAPLIESEPPSISKSTLPAHDGEGLQNAE